MRKVWDVAGLPSRAPPSPRHRFCAAADAICGCEELPQAYQPSPLASCARHGAGHYPPEDLARHTSLPPSTIVASTYPARWRPAHIGEQQRPGQDNRSSPRPHRMGHIRQKGFPQQQASRALMTTASWVLRQGSCSTCSRQSPERNRHPLGTQRRIGKGFRLAPPLASTPRPQGYSHKVSQDTAARQDTIAHQRYRARVADKGFRQFGSGSQRSAWSNTHPSGARQHTTALFPNRCRKEPATPPIQKTVYEGSHPAESPTLTAESSTRSAIAIRRIAAPYRELNHSDSATTFARRIENENHGFSKAGTPGPKVFRLRSNHDPRGFRLEERMTYALDCREDISERRTPERYGAIGEGDGTIVNEKTRFAEFQCVARP